MKKNENVIEIKNLIKKYDWVEVLKSINLEIKDWDFFALLGHNGAWKTTAINVLTNLVKKTSWSVKINWVDIDKDFRKARSYIWVVPQEFNFDAFAKVRDIPVIQAGYYGIEKKVAEERTEKLLKKLWIWEKRNNKAKELSWGMKRRLMIVRALVHKPKILVLDEPTAWVDVDLRKSMWEFITELNNTWTTIILTTHYLEEVEAMCKKVAILDNWKILENTTVKSLLSKMQEESIILTAKNDYENLLNQDFKQKYHYKKIDEMEFEITVKIWDTLNNVFAELSEQKVEISSFRNKTNRLEALFMKIIKK